MNIEKMIDEVRRVMSLCKASEKEVYEALLSEAEGWEMRLREIEEEEEESLI